MNISECWPAAYDLIANGDAVGAITLCERKPCSASLECQRYLGWTYYQQSKMEEALSWFARAAEQGDGEALFGIGCVHFAQRDFHLALQYYKRGADHGFSRAYGWLGYLYHQGLGVPKDLNVATNYYKQAAAHGYLIAERSLIHLAWKRGNLFRRILVVPQYIYLVAKTVVIAQRNINDPRLVDIPNAFDASNDASNRNRKTKQKKGSEKKGSG